MGAWKVLEKQVREIASSKWSAQANTEQICGINYDCVLHCSPDYHVIVECSKRHELIKVRQDILNLSLARQHYITRNQYLKAILVVGGSITVGMRLTAKEHKVDIYTGAEFIDSYFKYSAYRLNREKAPFGSCLDIDTGKSESTEYVVVKYSLYGINNNNELRYNKEIFLEDIASLLKSSKKIILIGEYGSGKSRCIKELFTRLADSADKERVYPFAINLRDCPSLKRHTEIIRRHYDDLGLSNATDSVLRMWDNENFIYMLDGFDEVSPQSWSAHPGTIKQIRHESLSSARYIFTQCHGGVLIAGREHYFSDNKEMLHALGGDRDSTFVVRCNEEFSDEELEAYLKTYNISEVFPEWIPRRPLIWRILTKLTEEERIELFSDDAAEAKFWDIYFNMLSNRESRMADIYTPGAIKKLLIALSRVTRSKPANIGPITQAEIKNAFEISIGTQPIDSASALLQRLVGLGRYEAESDHRVFADTFILDGLRALDVADILSSDAEKNVLSEVWLNPLRRSGVRTLSNELTKRNIEHKALQVAKRSDVNSNGVFISDIVAALLHIKVDRELQNTHIYNGHIVELDFAENQPSGLHIVETVVENLLLGNTIASSISLFKCYCGKVFGASSYQSLPAAMKQCSVDEFISYNISHFLKIAGLTDNQKVLISVIHKTFFQPGCARKEDALFRGIAAQARTAETKKIANILVNERILRKVKVKSGFIYVPERSYTERMRKLVESGPTSGDPLWAKVATL